MSRGTLSQETPRPFPVRAELAAVVAEVRTLLAMIQEDQKKHGRHLSDLRAVVYDSQTSTDKYEVIVDGQYLIARDLVCDDAQAFAGAFNALAEGT